MLGSASPQLVRGVSETLAGLVGLVDLAGFDLSEVGGRGKDCRLAPWRTPWLRGGFPQSFLAPDDPASALWRESFVQTFPERDIPQFGITIPAESLRRFWTMVAHYHGHVWNAAEFTRAIGAGQATARRYLDILSDARMVRILPPWHEDLKKWQVKSPKIHVRDAGVLHSLLELESLGALGGHPKVGASFGGFGIEQVLSCLNPRSAHFRSTHAGAELDLLVTFGGKRYGFDFKHSDLPGTTRSMRVAMEDLNLERLWVVYPGSEPCALDKDISALPVSAIPTVLIGWRIDLLPGLEGSGVQSPCRSESGTVSSQHEVPGRLAGNAEGPCR